MAFGGTTILSIVSSSSSLMKTEGPPTLHHRVQQHVSSINTVDFPSSRRTPLGLLNKNRIKKKQKTFKTFYKETQLGWSDTERGAGPGGFRKRSWVHFEREQFLGVHVVQRAQLGKFEQQLGEGGGCLLAVVLHHQVSQRPDQSVLQGLHCVEVLDP